MKYGKRWALALLLFLIPAISLFAGSEGFGSTLDGRGSLISAVEGKKKAPTTEAEPVETISAGDKLSVEEGEEYLSRDEVALYLYLYGELPPNYLTKTEAEELGWNSEARNLWKVAPGAAIGGNKFGNYEKLLPEKKGRKYFECDVNYDGGARSDERIVYSSDGLIFYTEDRFESFEELHPEEWLDDTSPAEEEEEFTVTEGEYYYSKDDVALYLHLYEELPPNYLTKQEAEELGWRSDKGNLWDVAPGMCIGGNKFGNYEGILPNKNGRKYYECDVNYEGGYRDAQRIIFSNDGLIYYTDDHYNSFEQLY